MVNGDIKIIDETACLGSHGILNKTNKNFMWVHDGKPYDRRCDVYSFEILLQLECICAMGFLLVIE